MKIRVVILFIFLLVAQNGHSQNKPTVDSIEVVKNLIRKTKSIESLYVGSTVQTSKQCLRFLFLLKRLNLEELITMSNDSSSCLRIYAYASLLYRKYKNAGEIRLSQEKDTTHLFYIRGCIGGTLKVPYILERVRLWNKKKEIAHWMKLYDEFESMWLKYLLTTKK